MIPSDVLAGQCAVAHLVFASCTRLLVDHLLDYQRVRGTDDKVLDSPYDQASLALVTQLRFVLDIGRFQEMGGEFFGFDFGVLLQR